MYYPNQSPLAMAIFKDFIFMNDKLSAKTVNVMSLETLYQYDTVYTSP